MEYTISVEKSDIEDVMNTVKLASHLIEDLEVAVGNNDVNKFNEAKIRIDLCDSEGNIIVGYLKGAVGWCRDEFILTGEVQELIK